MSDNEQIKSEIQALINKLEQLIQNAEAAYARNPTEQNAAILSDLKRQKLAANARFTQLLLGGEK